jgi:transposase
MVDYSLPAAELADLREAHRQTRDKRQADRIKAVVLLASNWSAEDVADALLVDPNTVRNHHKRYRAAGLPGLLHAAYRGSACELSESELAALDAHVQSNLYLTSKDVAAWVEETYQVSYTASGMTALLHRLGFVYKKPKLVPGKADPQKQEAFLAEYEELKKNKEEGDPILFMDAVHPQHNPVLGYGWIKRGQDRAVPSNTGRRRLNINGAIDLERMEPIVRYDESINADSTIALFAQILLAYAYASCIYIICDNARYYRSKAVRAYLENNPRIQLVFLPAYAPNLNLIERLWKLFKKKTLYNRYYETFDAFRKACEDFFSNPQRYQTEIRSLLTENFAITGG